MIISSNTWHRVGRIAAFVLTVVCLAYFVWQLTDSYVDVIGSFHTIGSQTTLIIAEFALMLMGIVVETVRWSIIRRFFTGGTLKADIIGTLRAISLGNATPANLGEHVGRAMGYDSKGRAFAASFIASVIQTTAIVILGSSGSVFIWEEFSRYHTRALFSLPICLAMFIPILLGCFLFLYIKLGAQRDKLKRFIGRRGFASMFYTSLLLNILKVCIFSTQLFLILNIGCHGNQFTLMATVFVYYLYVTVVPRINIIDIGIKGSLAAFFFEPFVETQFIFSASIFIWALNIILPSVLGFISLLFRKRNAQ